MKLRGLIVLLFAVASLWVGCAEPDGVEPIQDKETPQGQTVVRGVALMSDGSPAAHATVYLISDGMSQRRLSVLTDDAGAFEVDGAFVGEVTLVINNGAGQGHLEEITTFAGGSLDVGELVLAPLEQHARLVDIAQVGFEERVTREAGDYQHPAYNEDASKVYAARKIEGQTLWTLVEVDTATGQEAVLVRDVSLYTELTIAERKPLTLLSDRYLLYFDADGPSLYDVVGQRHVFRAKDHGLSTLNWLPSLHNDKRILFFEPVQAEQLRGDSLGGRKFIWRLRGYDWEQDRLVQISQLPISGWLSHPVWFHSHPKQAVVGLSEIIPVQYESGIYDEASVGSHVLAIDLNRLTVKWVGKLSLGLVVGQGPDHVLLHYKYSSEISSSGNYVEYPSGLASLDLNSMQLKTIVESDTKRILFGAVDGQGHHAAYWVVERDWSQHELRQVDLSSKQSAPVDLSYEAGLPLSCPPFGCGVRYGHAGDLQLFASVERGDDLRGVFAEFDGAAKRTYEIDVQEGSKEVKLWWNMLEVPQLMTKVFAWRVLETGFFQLFVDEPGQTAPRQRTFLPGHHEHFRLSADGQQLYYFTKDPLSGHVQLFRLRLNALPALP